MQAEAALGAAGRAGGGLADGGTGSGFGLRPKVISFFQTEVSFFRTEVSAGFAAAGSGFGASASAGR